MRHRPIPILTAAQIQRFWKKVDRAAPCKCWLWRGAVDGRQDGYRRPVFMLGPAGDRFGFGASRIAYCLHNRVDPADKEVCHTCDNPLCVNPQHLWLGTQQDNLADMVAKKRHRPAPARKLTADDVRRIRQAVGSQQDIAECFGVTQSNVSAIKLGKTWRNVK